MGTVNTQPLIESNYANIATPAPAVVNNVAGNQYNYFVLSCDDKRAIFNALGIVGGILGFAALVVYVM